MDPVTYHTIHLNSNSQLKDFLKTMMSGRRTLPFYAKHVKVVCIVYGLDTSDVFSVLRICTGLRSLACWIAPNRKDREALEIPPVLSVLRPRRLSLHYPFMLGTDNTDFRHPIFKDVTHLQVPGDWYGWQDWSWDHIEELPRLLHVNALLSVPDPEDGNLRRVIGQIRKCSQLLTLSFRIARDFECSSEYLQQLEQLREGDCRVVFVRESYRLVWDWLAHTYGGEDEWSRAQALVNKRRMVEDIPVDKSITV